MHRDSDPTPATGTPRPPADILARLSDIMEDWDDTGDSDTAHARLRDILISAGEWQTADTLREVRPASGWIVRAID